MYESFLDRISKSLETEQYKSLEAEQYVHFLEPKYVHWGREGYETSVEIKPVIKEAEGECKAPEPKKKRKKRGGGSLKRRMRKYYGWET
jgi:hypothetical protein